MQTLPLCFVLVIRHQMAPAWDVMLAWATEIVRQLEKEKHVNGKRAESALKEILGRKENIPVGDE